ncbi:MAG: AlwI family type II restriction endonuclease [Acetobacter sp.]|nr:AlwI family type II restriction endonuclease [Acetobacter sp.]
MKIASEKQIFNLMDTNGRRNDVVNALQGYLSILSNLNGAWDCLPNSLSQYLFYKQAIELSPDIFSKHVPFDNLQLELNNHPAFKNAIENSDLTWIQEHQNSYTNLIKKFDNGIEDRARHYTSNLVKLGFTDSSRNISTVGKLLLNHKNLKRDVLEKILPIDNINLIYLRQLLKLRIYNREGSFFYSPFLFALYILLNKKRISESEFFELVQGLNPYFDFDKLEDFISSYREGDILKNITIDVPDEVNNSLLSEVIFKKYFKNQKSNDTVSIYFKFYNLLYNFNTKKDFATLNELLRYYKENKTKLNKAFGCGKNIFTTKKHEKPTVEEFIRKNKQLFETNLNSYLYTKYELSKRLDQIREYSDTTKRIFSATGIISFKNGFVELAYKELCECIFNKRIIRININGNKENHDEYENSKNSYFCLVTSIIEIFLYSHDKLIEITNSIREKFKITDIDKIIEKIATNRKTEFNNFIDRTYPLEKVKEFLLLFNDRRNDSQIKAYVSPNATISTIYEFIVGLAWYYFSGKNVDILNSYNLTLSANFEPLVHAGGGQGDIIIYESNKIIMLEATLMNSNSQKRGEWEPVLRHSVNLKIDEELNGTQRQVITFFIADEFDANTINIWKAVAGVPMQSSINREKFTDNVIIMPISSNELAKLIDKSDKYDEIINNVHLLFEVERNNFNLNWRDDFIKKVI